MLSLLLIAGMALVLWLLLPGIVEEKAVMVLEDNGFKVQEFPVNHVGVRGIEVLPGAVDYSGSGLSWETIKVRYRPLEIITRKVDRVEIDKPVLGVDFPRPGPDNALSPETTALKDTGAEPGIPAEAMGAPSPGTAPGEIPAGDTHDVAGKEIGPTSGVKPGAEKRTSPWDPAFFFNMLEAIPVSELVIKDGQAKVNFPGEPDLEFGWTGGFLKSGDVASGELSLDGEDLVASLHVDGMKSARFLSARANVNLDTSRIAPVLTGIIATDLGIPNLPLISYPAKLSLEVLFETVSGDGMGLSGEASSGKMGLRFPEQKTLLQVDSVHLAGSAGPEKALVSAGIRLGKSIIFGLETDPFGIAMKMDQTGLLVVESEAITNRTGDWSAKSAFRGRSRFTGSGSLDHSRLEWSFAGIQGPGTHVEGFSVLLENDTESLQATVSPVGLRRNGTLWLEKGNLDWDFPAGTGTGSAEWYNAAGAYCGAVSGSFSGNEKYPLLVELQFSDKSDEPVFKTRYGEGKKQLFEADGHIPVDWINSLASWWGGVLPGYFSGEDIRLNAALAGKSPMFKGDLSLELPDCGFVSESGVVLEGIQAEGRFNINLVPRTLEPQELLVRSINAGEITLENCRMEWELPLVHRLSVNSLRADLDDGNIWIEPFAFNPLNPSVRTTLFFNGVKANKVLELLDEKRFSVEGTLSGSLEIGWEEGTVLLGEGQFRIDPANTGNRFRFLEPSFVDEHLSNLGSAPEELKERFRDALLREGIRLDELEVTFRSDDDLGQVSLRISLSGETKTDLLEIPIKGIVINNLISEEDLGQLLGMMGSVRMMDKP